MTGPPPPPGRFDDALLALAARHDGLRDLLGTLFSFLHRRTDLYVVDPNPARPMGFEAGAAERILLSAFRAFPYKDASGQPVRGDGHQRPRSGAAAPTAAAAAAAAVPRGGIGVPTAAAASDAPDRAASAAAVSASHTRQSARPAGVASSSAAAAAAVSGAMTPSQLPATAAPQPTPTAAVSAPAAPSPPPASTAAAAAAPQQGTATTPPSAAAPQGAATTPPSAAAPQGASTPSASHAGPSPASALERVRYTDAGLQIPVASGGVGPGYWWSQSLGEVTVHVDVPAGVRARDVVCDVTPKRLRVTIPAPAAPASLSTAAPTSLSTAAPTSLSTAAPTSLSTAAPASSSAPRLTLLDGPLYAEVRPGECLWTLEPAGADGGVTRARPVDPSLPDGAGMPPSDRPGWPCGGGSGGGGASCGPPGSGLLTVSLGKVVHTWWRRVVEGEGHPSIDATRVDSTQAVSEYDEETQAAIRKIVFDQAQAARGLPGSDELAAQALLRRAARAPGSPFGEPEVGGGGGGRG